jgi:hypothetical protein
MGHNCRLYHHYCKSCQRMTPLPRVFCRSVSSCCQLDWTPCHRYCSCRSAHTPLDPSGGSSYDVTGFSSLYTACRISRRWTWSWSDQEWKRNQSRAYIGKVSYYDGCNWLFLFVSCFLIGSFLAIWLVQFLVMWLVGDIKPFNPLFELNKFIIGHIRSRIRASHPSRGSPTGDIWSDIPQLPVAHHEPKGTPFGTSKGTPFAVTWPSVTSSSHGTCTTVLHFVLLL